MTLEQKIVVGFWACVALVIVGYFLAAFIKIGAMFGVQVGAILIAIAVPAGFVGMVIFSFWAFLR